jgi:uncharacterized protein YciI
MVENAGGAGAGWLPHYMVLYFSEPGARERIGELFPAHNAHARAFAQQHPGEPFLIGPFPEPEDGQPGALAVFHDRDLAAEFAAADPLVMQGAVNEWRIREWWVSPTSAAVRPD